MATGRVPTTANSPLTAKGDLFGYSTTQARVPVGNDGETLVADSSTSTGLRYQANFAAGKNKIINGDFNIWQRGTSFTIATGGGAYTADRFEAINESGANLAVSRQTFTPGTAPVAGYEGQYFCRMASTSATGDTYIVQRIEDVRTFAGQTVTVSFWAKCATGTVSSNGFYLQGFGTGGSSTVFANLGAVTITTSWQRFTQTIAIPSVSGKTIGANSSLTFQVLRYAASNTVDIWGVQIEGSPVATAFQTATGTIQGELAACQRYYYRLTPNATYNVFGSGFTNSATTFLATIPMPVPMRVAPTALEQSGTASQYSVFQGSAGFTCSSVPSFYHGNQFQNVVSFNVASGLTTGQAGIARTDNNSTAYLGWTAEL